MRLSIIIPVYNEKDTIVDLVKDVLAVQLPFEIEKEILIVDDGSDDGTGEILKNLEKNNMIRIFFEEENRGKAEAVKIGLQKARGDILLIQDADLEYSPEHYPALLKPILSGQTTVVYGSRFKGNIQNMTWINRMANCFSNWTMNILFKTKLSDIQTCFKVFKKEVIEGMVFTAKNFSFDTEITIKIIKRGYTIIEVPIEYVARKKSEGKKIKWGHAIENYYNLIKFRFLDK